AGIARIGEQIDFAETLFAIERIGDSAGARAEFPALLAHDRIEDRDRDYALEILELAENHGAMRVRAGERDIEMIAPALGRKAALARRSGAAVRRDPIAKHRLRPDAAPPRGRRG